MKETATARTVLPVFARVGVMLVALFTAVAPSTLARARSTKSEKQPISVVAHLALPEGPAAQIFLQERNAKQYLYIGPVPDGGFFIVDVTKPEKAHLVKQVAGQTENAAGDLRLIGESVVLITAPERGGVMTGVATRPTQSVSVLDVNDPESPRGFRNFSGVTSIFVDHDRGLIYLTDSEGLWILKQRQNQYQPPADYMGP